MKSPSVLHWLTTALLLLSWSHVAGGEKEEGSKDSTDYDYGGGYVPKEKVKTEAYLGLWYQAYASKSVIWTFELGGNCVTAEYFATDKDRTIRVKNTVRPFGGRFSKDYDKDGKNKKSFLRSIADNLFTLVVNGFATQSPDVDGQLSVELQAGPIPFGIGTPDIEDVMYTAPGNYWIIELGPIEFGKYRYAVVTNNKQGEQSQLYVLVRDVAEFESLYEQDVLWRINEKYGFTSTLLKARKTNQEDCGYPYGAVQKDEIQYNDDGDDKYDSKDKDKHFLRG